jgi:hypothetical protein
MKNHLCLILSLCFFGLCSIANAIPIYLLPGNADIAKNGTGGGGGNANANNDASNLFRLETVLHPPNAPLAKGSLNSLLPPNLPEPTLAGALDLGSNVVGAGGLTGFDYAVLQYGTGNGDNKGSGGGVEFVYLNRASQFAFPYYGTGPNGSGGFSSLTLFKSKPVPDGGSTVMLLGAALGLIAVARRKFRM